MIDLATRNRGPATSADSLDLVTRLISLARNGDAAAVAAHLAAGAPTDLADDQGDTILMHAAYYGQTDVAKVLVDAGADVDRRNDRGQTPLGAAVFMNHPRVMELLLEARADPLSGSPSALETALFLAKRDLADRLRRHVYRRRRP